MLTRNEAMAELERVFGMIESEYREADKPLAADSTEIVNAQRSRRGVSKAAVTPLL